MKLINVLVALFLGNGCIASDGFYGGLDIAYPSLSQQTLMNVRTDCAFSNISQKAISQQEVVFYPFIGYQKQFDGLILGIEGYFSTLDNNSFFQRALIANQKMSQETNFTRKRNFGAKVRVGYEIVPSWAVYYGIGLDRISYSHCVELKEDDQSLGKIFKKDGELISLSHTFGISKALNKNWSVRGEYFLLHPQRLKTLESNDPRNHFNSTLKNITYSTFKIGLFYSF